MEAAASTISPAAMPSTAVRGASNMPQHMRALAEANRIRLARASLKRRIQAGESSAAEVIRVCPEEVRTMSVGELLRSQERWGRTRARKFLFSLSLNENRQIGRLTARQRALVAQALDERIRRRRR